MSNGSLDRGIMTTQAENQKFKSVYTQARSIHVKLIQQTLRDRKPHEYVIALLNIAESGLSIGAPKDDLQRNCEKVREIFAPTTS